MISLGSNKKIISFTLYLKYFKITEQKLGFILLDHALCFGL